MMHLRDGLACCHACSPLKCCMDMLTFPAPIFAITAKMVVVVGVKVVVAEEEEKEVEEEAEVEMKRVLDAAAAGWGRWDF